LVLLERRESVAVLTLNRPERHNSLVPALLEELLGQLEAVGSDGVSRAVLLQANGRSFSTGGDLQGFLDHRDQLERYAATLVGLLNEAILALWGLPVPVIAAVQGAVTGGALGLTLAADVMLVAPEASLTPFYSVVGFSPDGGWTVLLPDLIGRRRAAEILLRNQTISAEQAVAWGMASGIVPGERLQEEALRVAREMAAAKPGALRHARQLLGVRDGDLADRLETERSHFLQQIVTGEAIAGMIAFLEKLRAGSGAGTAT
jgi:2-(1,2-epoxy-1,2-dihydrophenyl)acetyl-CoA isomerase